MSNSLPEYFHPLQEGEEFHFHCGPDVPCFTECCRELDLALTPYDCLRLKNTLKLHSGRFLEQYVIIEWDEQQLFPTCYLTMVDDGRASCVFVGKEGCTVYADRPASCRAYPLGRGVSQNPDGSLRESHVLIKEPHCKGFTSDKVFTAQSFFQDQDLQTYNRFNDHVLKILQHPKVLAGFRPRREQLDQYILALYNLDMFRQEFADGRLTLKRPLTAMELQGLADDDEALLHLGITWLLEQFFAE